MNKRLFARLAWTGIASPLLMMLAYEMDGSRFSWFAVPFYAPGLLTAAVVFRMGGHAGSPESYLAVAFGLNFIFIWIMLLVILKLVERLFLRLKVKAAH
jgi:hypothetical protein